jgi:hypothetical protein
MNIALTKFFGIRFASASQCSRSFQELVRSSDLNSCYGIKNVQFLALSSWAKVIIGIGRTTLDLAAKLIALKPFPILSFIETAAHFPNVYSNRD